MKTTMTLNEQREYVFKTIIEFRFWYYVGDYDLLMRYYRKIITCYHLGFISYMCRNRAYHMKKELEKQKLKKLVK